MYCTYMKSFNRNLMAVPKRKTEECHKIRQKLQDIMPPAPPPPHVFTPKLMIYSQPGQWAMMAYEYRPTTLPLSQTERDETWPCGPNPPLENGTVKMT